MSKVVRYFHVRPVGHGHGGATVKVTGDANQVGQVDVQVAFCSKKDMFCKKTGRAEAAKTVTKIVPLRYLPQEMSRIQKALEQKLKWPCYGDDWTFTLKYFLPKE